jgi:hypothetical protein
LPKTKKTLATWGTVCEIEETYTTHWVQSVGDTIVRCDDDAKEKGFGAWTMIAPTRSATWVGTTGCTYGIIPDPENWIRDNHVESFIVEVDYS